MTLKKLDKEKERDENITKKLDQIEILQEHIKRRGEVFKVEKGSYSGYLQSE